MYTTTMCVLLFVITSIAKVHKVYIFYITIFKYLYKTYNVQQLEMLKINFIKLLDLYIYECLLYNTEYPYGVNPYLSVHMN